MNIQYPMIGFYESCITPWLTSSKFNDVYQVLTRHKKASISAAAALVGLCFLYDRVFLPPRNVRHIPHVSFPTYVMAVMAGRQPKETARNITMPAASRSSHGLYLVGQLTFGSVSLLYLCPVLILAL